MTTEQLRSLTRVAKALALVDPELREQAERMLEMASAGLPGGRDLLAMLRTPRPSVLPLLDDVPVLIQSMPNAAGHPDVLAYVINAQAGRSRPLIIDIHGGGFIFGTAKDSVPVLQRQAQELDCAIITVEYRLAPETCWLGAREDNYAALKWVHANAASLGGDPDRIIVSGSSAGGGHAAILAITARDRGEVPIHFLELASPMLDDCTGSSCTVAEHLGVISWSSELNRIGWQAYLGCEPGTVDVPNQAVPARIGNLEGLPSTFIHVGAIDLFAGEAIEFARRLVNAGVPTELFVAPGVFHGGGTATAAISRQIEAVRKSALERAFSVGGR